MDIHDLYGQEMSELSLRDKHIRALDDLAEIISVIWGDRCSENEPNCPCCAVWAIYDCLNQLTDSSILDEVKDE